MCCAGDEGWPFGFAVQAEIPNHRKLRRLRAGVVSVAAKALPGAGQVGDEKTNVCEPLLTNRNVDGGIETGEVHGPGERGASGGVPEVRRRPVCWPGGARCIGGVSSS